MMILGCCALTSKLVLFNVFRTQICRGNGDMKIQEDYAKKILTHYGLNTPDGEVANTQAEAAAIAEKLGGKGVVKALVPTGGRGKAGGVKVCATVEQVNDATQLILGSDLLGHTVNKVLIEEVMPIDHEIYAAVIVNTATGKIDILVSFAGGVEIEKTAQTNEVAVHKMAVDPGDILPVYRLRNWLKKITPKDFDCNELARVLVTLHRAAADIDALLLEVNPLAVLKNGFIAAIDCKLDVDDNSLVRHPDLIEMHVSSLSTKERRARALGVSYVPLDGDIGVITSGAGLGMATIDLLKRLGLSAANFLDTGGGISEDLVQGALELIMESSVPQVRGAVINLYGGINRMVEAANGIVAALKNIGNDRPIVVKILGNQQEEAWSVLEPVSNVFVIRTVQTEEAIAKLASLL